MSEDPKKPDDPGETAAPEADAVPDAVCGEGQFVIPGPPLPNGARMCLHHAEDHTFRTGVMKPMEDGKPIDDEAMLLEKREGSPVYDVVGTVGELKKGPSKVNSPAFKDGWDRIFGKSAPVGKA